MKETIKNKKSRSDIMPTTRLKLDFNLLQVLAILLEEKSVTAAASRLNLSQSAVSKHLSRLRDMFCDQLFERTAQGLKPTPRVIEMAPQLRNVLQQLEQITRPAAFEPATSRRRFRIHLPETAYALTFPYFMPTLLNQAPNTRLTTQNWNQDSLDMLLSCEIDLAIECREWDVRSPIHMQHIPPELNHAELLRDKSVCLLRDGHPALSKKWDLSAFLDYRHIQVTFGGMESWLLDDVLALQGLSRNLVVNMTDFHSAMSLCEHSDLVLCAPARHAEKMAQHFNLKIKQVPVHFEPGAYVLLWHKHFEQDLGHKWLREIIISKVTPIYSGTG
jgi:DNA-binding transcriptional LysR family regulator